MITDINQFATVGQLSFLSAMAKVLQDVPPYMIVDGNPATTRGLNAIGLQRRGFAEEDMKALKKAYKKLFLKKDRSMSDGLSSLKAMHEGDNVHVKQLIEFIEASERGVTR